MPYPDPVIDTDQGEIERENVELIAEVQEKEEQLRGANRLITELRRELQLLREDQARMIVATAVPQRDSYASSSDDDSVASVSSARGTLRPGFRYTGFQTKVRGIMYPIVEGPEGAEYTRREDNRFIRLSAKQHRDKVATLSDLNFSAMSIST